MGDLISRSALLQEFEKETDSHYNKGKGELWHITGIKAIIENAPTVEAIKTFNLPCYNCNSIQTSTLVKHDYDNDIWSKCTVCGSEYPLSENELKNINVKVYKEEKKEWKGVWSK